MHVKGKSAVEVVVKYDPRRRNKIMTAKITIHNTFSFFRGIIFSFSIAGIFFSDDEIDNRSNFKTVIENYYS